MYIFLKIPIYKKTKTSISDKFLKIQLYKNKICHKLTASPSKGIRLPPVTRLDVIKTPNEKNHTFTNSPIQLTILFLIHLSKINLTV